MTDKRDSFENGDHAIRDDSSDQLTDWISMIYSKKPRNRTELEQLRVDLEDETEKIAKSAKKRD